MSQGELFSGEILRDMGMQAAAAAQESETPGFAMQAYAAVVAVARRQPTVHVDDVLAFGLEASHPNAWGAIWMRAIKNRIIVRSGRLRPCLRDPGKHKHQYPVYTSMIVGGRDA